MANYKIKKEEFLKYYKSSSGSKKYKIIRFWIIFSIIISISFYFGQYLFSVFLIVLAVIFTYMIKIKFTEEFRYDNNPFLNSKINLELNEEFYRVTVKENDMTLSVKEIGKVEDLKDHYRIDHKCGNGLIVPKNILSEQELKIIKYYKRKNPKSKWKIQMW